MRLPLHVRRAWVAPLVVAALALAFGQDSAKAATPPAATVSAGAPVSFTGHLEMTNFGECPSQAMDPMNLVCEHFTATVTSAGTLGFCVPFPPGVTGLNDLDLFLFNEAQTEVAASATSNNPEVLTFTTSGPGTFELRINPSFLEGPIDFTGTASLDAADPCNPQTGGGAGGGVVVDPPITIHDASVVAPDSGTANMVFPVSLDGSSLSPITVKYMTVDNSATALEGDYVPQVGEVVFAPGQTRAYISVPVLPDLTLDPDENFLVNLQLPGPPYIATIADGQGIGTIRHERGVDRVTGGGSIVAGQGTLTLRVLENRNGKLRWVNGADSFRATSISSVTFTDATRTVGIAGAGVHDGIPVTYNAEVQDNGDLGATDTATLRLSDGKAVSGTLASGNIAYVNR
jgi:hypothetical protein